MNKPIAGVLLGIVLAATLAGCSSGATFTQTLGSANADLKELDGTVESDFELPYGNITYSEELESGTVDIEIVDLQQIGVDDDADFVELDTIFEAKGVASGDHLSFSDDDGLILVRVSSGDKATGTITFVEE